MQRRLLWIGDACVASGFARATHYTLDGLRATWDVHVLGINYTGDPHKYPYPVYPCWPGKDLFGVGRVIEMVRKLRPDLIVVQNDPWNVPAYMEKAGNVPTVASMAVDGKNCRGRSLNGLAMAIFWTKFGETEARLGGYAGPSAVVPLGVDLNIYQPRDRTLARQHLGLPAKIADAFIVGNVNRNQPRKRLDLTLMYFAEWIHSYQVRDAYLFLHVAPTGDMGYDVDQLAKHLGISNRLILAEPDIGQGVDEDRLVSTYGCFDVQLSTTQGEGFGLTTLEGMACGIPQIVPDWAALGELCADAAILVPCTTFACTPNKINVVGGIPDREATVAALEVVYRNREVRDQLRTKALARANQPEFRWENISEAFGRALETALAPARVAQTAQEVA